MRVCRSSVSGLVCFSRWSMIRVKCHVVGTHGLPIDTEVVPVVRAQGLDTANDFLIIHFFINKVSKAFHSHSGQRYGEDLLRFG